MSTKTKVNTAQIVTSEDGDGWLLADDREQADAFIRDYWDDEHALHDVGWMINTGWDRDNYTLKREFVEETGFTSWWTACAAPADGLPTRKLRRAFEMVPR